MTDIIPSLKGIQEKLVTIQQELKVPKKQFNDFGNYSYRNLDDILEAAKPILAKLNCTLTLSDEIILIGERYYVKSTATLRSKEAKIETSAYAREAAERKKMDDSQLTGTASAYARKSALTGLLLIDDTKDADFHQKEDESDSSSAKEITSTIIEQLSKLKTKEQVRQNYEFWKPDIKKYKLNHLYTNKLKSLE